MQRIVVTPLAPEDYVALGGHRLVVPDSVCPNCQQPSRLHRHGCYSRWAVSVLGALLRLWIARFLCRLCRHTISYLPDFALSYRLVGPETFEAFLDGDDRRADVRTYFALLTSYRRRFESFGEELVRSVGAGLGLAPPPKGLWPWLKKAGDGLRPITRQLVTVFRIGLFRRYQCHQPAGP